MISGKAPCGVLYAVRRSSSAVGYCALSTRCGTRSEDGFRLGTAHFAEHTVFKGTSRKSARVIGSYLDRLGGELNAFTTKEEIVLHATVLKEDLSKASGLLLELATCATFPEGEVETERGVVVDEIYASKDTPADDIYDRFEEMAFKGHPLGRPILGTAESVRKISTDELRRFVSGRFRPEAMAFTLVADEDERKMEKAVLRMLDKFFPGHVAGDPVAGVAPVAVPLDYKAFDAVHKQRNHEANAVIGNLAPSLYDGDERVVAVLLSNILAGPASNSVLGEALREKNGWVYGVESSYTPYADTGIFVVSLGCEKANLDLCLEETDRQVRKMQQTCMSEPKLRAAKKQLLGQMAIASDNGEAQCLSMGKSLLAYGTIDSDASVRSKVGAVTAESLREMACRIFDPSTLSRLVYL